jgi:CheY-like chemotaxis protein
VNDDVPRSRLLIVEDDADNLEALSIFLGEKYTVFGYQSPIEALDALVAVRPDLLLLDIGTAPIDGVDCLKRIRGMPGYVEIPAVAFTGFGRDVERRAFLTAGFDAVVVKPVADPRDLVAVIEEIVVVKPVADPRDLVAVIEEILASRREDSLPSFRGPVDPGRSSTTDGRDATRHLDAAPTTSASFGRAFGKGEGPGWPRSGDENAG